MTISLTQKDGRGKLFCKRLGSGFICYANELGKIYQPKPKKQQVVRQP